MSQMNVSSAADSYNNDGLPPEFWLGENNSFLISPHELKMASSIEEDFPKKAINSLRSRTLLTLN